MHISVSLRSNALLLTVALTAVVGGSIASGCGGASFEAPASYAPKSARKDVFDALPKATSCAPLDNAKCLGASSGTIEAAQRHLTDAFNEAGVPNAVWHKTDDGFVVVLSPELLDDKNDGQRLQWGTDYKDPDSIFTSAFWKHITVGTTGQARRIVIAVSTRPVPNNPMQDPRPLGEGGTLTAPGGGGMWSPSHRCYALIYRYTTTGSQRAEPVLVHSGDPLSAQAHLEKAGLWSKM